jgi:hypothetical protein
VRDGIHGGPASLFQETTTVTTFCGFLHHKLSTYVSKLTLQYLENGAVLEGNQSAGPWYVSKPLNPKRCVLLTWRSQTIAGKMMRYLNFKGVYMLSGFSSLWLEGMSAAAGA